MVHASATASRVCPALLRRTDGYVRRHPEDTVLRRVQLACRECGEELDDRYGRSSTVMTSQLPCEKWHAYLGDPTLADANRDRVMHNGYEIQLKGPSGRKTEESDTKS